METLAVNFEKQLYKLILNTALEAGMESAAVAVFASEIIAAVGIAYCTKIGIEYIANEVNDFLEKTALNKEVRHKQLINKYKCCFANNTNMKSKTNFLSPTLKEQLGILTEDLLLYPNIKLASNEHIKVNFKDKAIVIEKTKDKDQNEVIFIKAYNKATKEIMGQTSIHLQKANSPYKKNILRMRNLVVNPKYRRNGIASLILAHVAKESIKLKKEGYVQLELVASPFEDGNNEELDIDKLIQLYKKVLGAREKKSLIDMPFTAVPMVADIGNMHMVASADFYAKFHDPKIDIKNQRLKF